MILEPQEKQVVSLLQSLDTIRKEKDSIRKSKIALTRSAYQKKQSEIESMDTTKRKERRKEFFKQMDFKEKKDFKDKKRKRE